MVALIIQDNIVPASKRDTSTLVVKYSKGEADIWVVLSVKDAEYFECNSTGYKWFLRYVGDDGYDDDVSQVLTLNENHIWYGSAWSSDQAKAMEIARDLEDLDSSEHGIKNIAFTQEQIDFAENHKMSWDECDTYADEGVNMGYGGDNGDAYDEPRRYDVSWRRACMCPDCGVLQPDY